MLLTAYLILLFFSVAKLGAGIAMTAVIVGQLVTSMIVDHFGWFGSDVTPFTMKRFIGVLLMTVALYCIYMESAIVKKKQRR